MDYLIAIIAELFENEEMMMTVFVLAVGGAVFATGLAVLMLVSGFYNPVRLRLAAIGGRRRRSGLQVDDVARRVEPLAPYIIPQAGQARRKTQRQLIYAGYRGANAELMFYAVKALLGVFLPLGAVVAATWGWRVPPEQLIWVAGIAAAVGLLTPSVFLDKRAARRQRRLRNGLPDALDLLVVCTEAGLGLRAAIQRVAQELAFSHPELAVEFEIVNAEARAGVEREQALKNLADRTGLEDIRGLVAMLSQSMRFGASIADALRIYADEFRDKRMQQAEEIAAKLGTKMIFPLVLCLFPAFFVIAIGPAVLGVLRVLQNM